MQYSSLLLCMALVCGLQTDAPATTSHVPGQCPTVQAGINAGVNAEGNARGTSFDYEMRFNCGGDISYLTSNGEFYLPDRPYTPENHAGYVEGHREEAAGPFLRVNTELLPDEFMGVFSEIQDVDEKLLSAQGRDEGASIDKCMSNLAVLPETSLYPRAH